MGHTFFLFGLGLWLVNYNLGIVADICQWTAAENETTNFRCNEGAISGFKLSENGLTQIYCCLLNEVKLNFKNILKNSYF